MEDHLSKLEFIVSCMADIRFLWKKWQLHLSRLGLAASESSFVYVCVERQEPVGAIRLDFMETPEVLKSFLRSLEESGLKFTTQEFIPGLLTICRVIREQGGLKVIDLNGHHSFGEEQEESEK